MKQIFCYLSCAMLLYAVACQTQGENKSVNSLQLVWSDEFEYQGHPDQDKWTYDVGDGCPTLCGWGNNEKQVYTNKQSNVRVENGVLIIEAHATSEGTANKFTSARLVTKNKGDWKYGRIEVRARLPKGRGTWPAIWMLPTNWKYGDWPGSGEIDIMEHVGYDLGKVHGTVHTEDFNHIKGTHKGDSIVIANVSEEFHTYEVKWSPQEIQFIVNKKVYNTFLNNGKGPKAWPFDQPFHLILNIAIGGNWGGKYGIESDIFPQRMEIDYVRVYQKENQELVSKN